MNLFSTIVAIVTALFRKPDAETAPTPDAISIPSPVPQPLPPIPESLPTLDVLARTLWGEARGQGVGGMAAVCCVIVNRAKQPGWWGRDVRSVCLAPLQFSCWNANDPQYKLMHAVSILDAEYRSAVEIASRALAGNLPDMTNGADHYCTSSVHPAWQKGREPVYEYGTHLFYRIGLGG